MDVKKEEVIRFLVEAMFKDAPDSLEIGTAGKGGCVKVYGSYDRPVEFRAKIDAALELRKYAGALTNGGAKEGV